MSIPDAKWPDWVDSQGEVISPQFGPTPDGSRSSIPVPSAARSPRIEVRSVAPVGYSGSPEEWIDEVMPLPAMKLRLVTVRDPATDLDVMLPSRAGYPVDLTAKAFVDAYDELRYKAGRGFDNILVAKRSNLRDNIDTLYRRVAQITRTAREAITLPLACSEYPHRIVPMRWHEFKALNKEERDRMLREGQFDLNDHGETDWRDELLDVAEYIIDGGRKAVRRPPDQPVLRHPYSHTVRAIMHEPANKARALELLRLREDGLNTTGMRQQVAERAIAAWPESVDQRIEAAASTARPLRDEIARLVPKLTAVEYVIALRQQSKYELPDMPGKPTFPGGRKVKAYEDRLYIGKLGFEIMRDKQTSTRKLIDQIVSKSREESKEYIGKSVVELSHSTVRRMFKHYEQYYADQQGGSTR